MEIGDLFSKRQKRLKSEMPDVFSYDFLPEPLRVQISYILDDSLGNESQYNFHSRVESVYNFIVKTICREHGLAYLGPGFRFASQNHYIQIRHFIISEQDVEKVLDVIELCFRVVDTATRQFDYRRLSNSDEVATKSIEELNYRFLEHGVGFQFEEGRIIRIDSTFIHKEVVVPTLTLLSDPAYQGAQEEFLQAHEHYRHGLYKEAMNECLKSFESIMKAICDKREWSYQPSDTAKDLIKVCFKNELVPKFWQSQMTHLRCLLESGVPTVRNKLSGHGQGSLPTTVPEHILTYVLHMTASCIHFLAEAEKALPE